MRAYSPSRPDTKKLSFLLLVFLAGCAVQRGRDLPPMPDWEARRDILANLPEWEFEGRIGVSSGEEGFNGNLRWWQKGDLFRASVSGPLGVGTVRMQGDGDSVTVTDSDGKVTELENAEAELRAMYGWTIPVTSLRYWALGIPDPASPAATRFGENGQLARLEQRDWTVRITDYQMDGGQLMPSRMTALNHDTKVRLVIDDWTFHEAPVLSLTPPIPPRTIARDPQEVAVSVDEWGVAKW